MRGAAESAAVACYLTAEGIDPLERVRRNMNLNLAAPYEDTRLIGQFGGPAAQQQVSRHKNRTDAIARTGALHGFQYAKPNPYWAGYIGDQPPTAMTLIDEAAGATAGVGATYHRLLSGVSHGHLHALTRLCTAAPG